jgi:hypothetical protein
MPTGADGDYLVRIVVFDAGNSSAQAALRQLHLQFNCERLGRIREASDHPRLLNLDDAFRTGSFNLFDTRDHVSSEGEERLGMGRILALQHGRRSAIR